MGTEQALKNGISAYHYNILKLLKEWQPVVFNTKDDAISWRNVSTGEEVDTEMLDWVGDIEVGEPLPRVPWGRIDILEKCLSGCEQDDLRRKSRDLFEYVSLLEARHEEINSWSDSSDNGIGDDIDTVSDNYQLVSLLDYVIECLMKYRDESRGLITTEEINSNLLSKIKFMMQLYENAYALQIESDEATTNYQYEIHRRYLGRARKSLEHLNSSQLEVAREWLIDCFSTQEEEIREASSAVIEAEVIRLCGSLDALDYGDDSEEPSISDISVSQNLLTPLAFPTVSGNLVDDPDIRAILHNQS